MAIIPNDDLLHFYDHLERLSGCQEVFVLPQGFKSTPPLGGVRWPTFASIEQGLASFDVMAVTEPSFDQYMAGHPGHPGGVPTGPVANPILFGVKDPHGTEWWLTDAEGITGSATWEQNNVVPATDDGAWPMSVRGRARRVVLKGTGIAPNRKAALHSSEEMGSALASGDRTGWLHWKDDVGCERQLPVAMSGPIKMLWKSGTRFDVEIECGGLNLGSAGKGVFLEESAVWHEVAVPSDTQIPVPGGVATPPLIEVIGPCAARAISARIGDYAFLVVDSVPLGSTLTIDCATHQITLDGARARQAVVFLEDRWPLLQTGHADIGITADGVTTTRVRVMVTPLW